MSTFIHHIETAVPDTRYDQAFIRDEMKRLLDADRKTARLLHYVYGQSGIEKRHSAIRDFTPSVPEGAFYDPVQDRLKSPSTGVRNALYTDVSKELYACVAQQAVARCPDLEASQITHVITVSCTGFFAPGPDYHIVRSLGLSPATKRFHLGFMGCYAAFPALKMAQAFCEADPDAVVLVVCLELCTLHLKFQSDPDSLISASVFADGAAAAVVSARPPQEGRSALEMTAFATTLTPHGRGGHGLDGRRRGLRHGALDVRAEHHRGKPTRGAGPLFLLKPTLQKTTSTTGPFTPVAARFWTRWKRVWGCHLKSSAPSREVLRDYGNMSSATVLFILQKLLAAGAGEGKDGARKDGEKVYAMAFGPGLTVESGLFTRRA